MEARPQHHAAAPRLLSPARVVAVGLVAVAAVFAAWVLRDETHQGRVPLMGGSVLPTSELVLMEAAFDRAKLTDYAVESGRILVPRGKQSGYMRALVDAEALPREFGGSLRRVLEEESPWSSRTARDERLRVAIQEELALVLRSMPGIRRAAVLYDAEEQAGLSGRTRRTASVNVETDDEHLLDPLRARGIRLLVAAAIAGLDAEEVTVTDLRTGLVHAGPLDESSPAENPADAPRLAAERSLARRLREALAHVPGAVVDVRIELAPAESTANPPADRPRAQPRAAANMPASLAARPAPPAAARADKPADEPPGEGLRIAEVHAAIAVPQPRGVDKAEAEAMQASIRRHALELLPHVTDPAGRQVTVTAFPLLAVAEAKVSEPPTTLPPQEARPGPRLPEPFDQLAELPREIWLAAASGTVGLLAAVLWWFGGRTPPPVVVAEPIDWAGLAGSSDRPGRAAAWILVMLSCAACGAARGEPAEPAPPASAVPATPLQVPAESNSGQDADEPPTTAWTRGLDPIAMAVLVTAAVGLGVLAVAGRRRRPTLPADVFELLGESVAGGQRVRVLRFGPKTLLVAVGSGGCTTLSEIADPKATEAIARACAPRNAAVVIATTPPAPPTPQPLERAS